MKRKLKSLIILLIIILYRLRRRYLTTGSVCKSCGDKNVIQQRAFGRVFDRCGNCDFVFANDFPHLLSRVLEFSVDGSWGGVGEGGGSDHFLSSLLKEYGVQEQLILGAGCTRGVIEIAKQNTKVKFSDTSHTVISYLKENFGDQTASHPAELSETFEAVIACEVIEHLLHPRGDIEQIINMLSLNGIFCGTTDLLPIDAHICELSKDSGSYPGYMSFWDHQCYWSEKSLKTLFNAFGFSLKFYRIEVPGLVQRDAKYETFHDRKRCFFISRNAEFFDWLERKYPKAHTLPLNNRTYWLGKSD